MTLGEVSEQQLDTHPDLEWCRGETDRAKQRVNWLRSMELVERRGEEYTLTDDGLQFIASAVEEWADSDWTPSVAMPGCVLGGTKRLDTPAWLTQSSVRQCCRAMTKRALKPQYVTQHNASLGWV